MALFENDWMFIGIVVVVIVAVKLFSSIGQGSVWFGTDGYGDGCDGGGD